jgi:hypothetical protein
VPDPYFFWVEGERWLAVRGKISKRGYGVGEACPASTTSTPKISQNL